MRSGTVFYPSCNLLRIQLYNLVNITWDRHCENSLTNGRKCSTIGDKLQTEGTHKHHGRFHILHARFLVSCTLYELVDLQGTDRLTVLPNLSWFSFYHYHATAWLSFVIRLRMINYTNYLILIETFCLHALQLGLSTLWILVTKHDGLVSMEIRHIRPPKRIPHILVYKYIHL